MNNQIISTVIAPAFVASMISTAAAGPALVTYRFGQMSGDFVLFTEGEEQGAAGTFTATAVSNQVHDTSGDITRLDHRPGTSEFNPGFAAVAPFSVSLLMDVTNIAGSSALGNGVLSITDADGDMLLADISGVFSQNGSFLDFNGVSANYRFSGTGDSFDGINGAIMIDDLIDELFAGAASLQITAPAGLTQSFTGATTNMLGQFIPAPAGTVAFIAGIGLSSKRRR